MTASANAIPFVDLAAQQSRLKPAIESAIARVLAHGQYILGPEVGRLEARLAAYVGVSNVVTCASGTDALLIAMLARKIRVGDAVFVPAFGFVAAAEVAVLVGATPYFVDVLPDSFNMAPGSLEAAVAAARDNGLHPAAVIPNDLYGQMASYPAIGEIAGAYGLFVLQDAAQSFGASLDGVRAGAFGDAAGTSFFPSKPLGCYGDGGAIFTNDDSFAERLRLVRVHGQGANKYHHADIGLNGRLDTLQAAVLLEKLAIFDEELQARQKVADRYSVALADIVEVPRVAAGATSVWAHYTITVDRRDEIAAELKELGIPTAIHYPRPLTRQPAYDKYPMSPGGVPVSEQLAARVLSLPMHAYLDERTQDRIIEAVCRVVS